MPKQGRKRWQWMVVGAVSVVIALVGAGPVWASYDGIQPTFRGEQAWFHCAGPVPANNAGWWVQGASPWDTTAPTGSLSQGDGCMHADAATSGDDSDSPHDAVFYGSFSGNLRDLTVTLYDVAAGRLSAEDGGAVALCVRLTVDTNPVLPTDCKTAPPVWATPTLDESGLIEKLEFSITGLGSVTEVRDEQGNLIDVQTSGLATEDGNGSQQRTLVVTVSTMFARQAGLFAWDTVETPSGITFNPDTLAPGRIKANNP